MKIEARRMLLSATAENASRWCWVGFRIVAEGSGELLIPEPLVFGIAFSEPPLVSVGADMAGMSPWQLRRTDVENQVKQTPYQTGALPVVSAVVTEWITETMYGKFVIAARAAVYVDAAGATDLPVTIHLLFQGDALKIFPGTT